MTTQTQDSIIEKVRSILDRANHPNTPQAEAETALALAQKLITKYNLDESALLDRVEDEEIVKDEIVVLGPWALRRLMVAHVIARANSCSTYRSSRCGTKPNGRYGKLGYTLYMYGTKADIFATKVLWTSAEALALRLIPKGDKSFRNSWWIGFASGIGQVLRKANDQAVVEAGGSALVLVERQKRAEQERNAQVPGLRTTYSSGASNGNGYSAGASAGRSFNSNGIGRGAIGAIGR